MVTLSTLQNFWDLGRNTLVDFLAARGLKISGGKTELAARAFTAVEIKLFFIESSEEQQAKLKKSYAGRLKKYSICGPMNVEETKRGTAKWNSGHQYTVVQFFLTL